MKTIAQIINSKEPPQNLIDAAATVLEGLHLLNGANLSYLIVLKGDKYAGVFSEHEYVRRVLLENKNAHNTLIEDVMKEGLPAISGTDTAENCLMVMTAFQTRYLPVFEDFDFLGIITLTDLVNEALEDVELRSVARSAMRSDLAREGFSGFEFMSANISFR